MFDTQGGMPFDTMSVALCHRSAQRDALTGHKPPGTADQAMYFAVAAWMAVVSESWEEAQELAQLALQIASRANGEGSGDVLVAVSQGLVDIIALLHLGLPVNHGTLDRIVGLLTSSGPSAIESFAPMLEIPNWFTFSDRYHDAGRISDRQLLDARAAQDLPGVIWSRLPGRTRPTTRTLEAGCRRPTRGPGPVQTPGAARWLSARPLGSSGSGKGKC